MTKEQMMVRILTATKQELEAVDKILSGNGNQHPVKEVVDRIVTFKEAGEILSCSKRSLHNWINKGILPKVCFPGCTRARGLRATDIEKLLEH